MPAGSNTPTRVVEVPGRERSRTIVARLIWDTTTALPPRRNLCTRDRQGAVLRAQRQKLRMMLMATLTWIPSKKPPIILWSDPRPLRLLAVSLLSFRILEPMLVLASPSNSTRAHTLSPTAKRTYKVTALELAWSRLSLTMTFLWVHRLVHRVLLRQLWPYDLPITLYAAA